MISLVKKAENINVCPTEGTQLAPGVKSLGVLGPRTSLFGPMKKIPLVEFQRGVRIIGCGQAGNWQEFVVLGLGEGCNDDYDIIALYPDRKPEELDEYCLDGYFSRRSSVSSETAPLSAEYGIGMYYDDSETAELIPEDVIQNSLRCVERLDQIEKERDERVEREKQEERDRLIKGYDYLTRITDPNDFRGNRKLCGENIRTELKHEFPGVKFSVRYRKGGEYSIKWTDGPTEQEVDDIVRKFDNQHFDAYQDYWETRDSIFNTLYGGVPYIFTDRFLSDEAFASEKAKLMETYEWLNDDTYDIEKLPHVGGFGRPGDLRNYVYQKLHQTSLYVKPEEPAASDDVKTDGLRMEDYSEKAFVVLGDTKPIAGKLKNLGGKFNARLKCGPAWVFSKKKENDVRKALNI